MANFITKTSFDNKVAEQRERDTTTHWIDINRDTVYKINGIRSMVGRYGDCWLADATDNEGNVIKFFAPPSMIKKIKKEKRENQAVYFISLGQTFNKLDKTRKNQYDVIFEVDSTAVQDIFVKNVSV